MRKFLYAVAVLLLVCGCTRKEVIVSTPCGFDIRLEKVHGTKVWVKIIPQNPDAAYAMNVISSYDPSYNHSPEDLAAEMVSIMRTVFSKEREAGNFSDQFCFRGERSLKYHHLVSDTDHKLILMQMNPKEQSLVGKPVVVTFHTRPVAMDTDLRFTVAFDAGKLTITPSDPEKTYYWEFENSNLIEKEYITTNEFFYKVIDLYEDYDFMPHMLDKGPAEWDFYARDQEVEDGEDLTLMIAGYADGEINTPLTTVRFICHRDGPIEVVE